SYGSASQPRKDENPWVRRSEPAAAGGRRWGGGNADPAQRDFAWAKPILSRAPAVAHRFAMSYGSASQPGKDENPWVRRSEPAAAGGRRWGGGNADPAQRDLDPC